MAKAKDAIGLDIGSSGVRAAHVTVSRRPFTLEAFGQVPLPPGAVRDGEIIDAGVVSQAISQLWRHVRFRSKRVILGVANQKVVVRPIDLPFMEEEELRGAIQFQVQDYIPIPMEDAIVDFQVLDEFVTDNNERMMRVLVVAAQRDMISVFVEATQQAGLDPLGIDHIPFALIRSLGETGGAFEGPAPGEAIIDIGAGVTDIVVHEGGTPRFARTLMVGGNALTEALGAGLGISFEDAEAMKKRMGVTGGGGEPSAEAAPRILEQRAAAFVDEVRGSLDYYLAQAEATRVGKVVLSGGGSKLMNLPNRVANALRLPVEQGRILQRIRVGKAGLSEQQLAEAEPFMAAAVGLALGVAEE
ncbi:MAG: type IV pilus assembly protein PilM [Actinomycetota bacterium]